MTVQSVLSKVTKAAIALPVVAAGLALNAGSAEAAGLTGGFQINNFATTVNLGINAGSQNTNAVDLVFVNPLGDAEVALSAQEGDFIGFESAFIKDLIPADIQTVNSFLDLSIGEPAPFDSNVQDGLITFDVTSNDGLDITQQVDNLIAIDISLGGIFNTNANDPGTNETSKGQAIFTLQYAENGITVEDFTARLQAGEIFEDIAFSAAAFTATGVPEPTTILGLLAVSGLAGAAIRKRKADA